MVIIELTYIHTYIRESLPFRLKDRESGGMGNFGWRWTNCYGRGVVAVKHTRTH